MDEKKSYKDLKLLANENDAEAQFLLGLKFFEGDEVSHDYYSAVKYFLLSAKQNYAAAQCYLGICYESGYSVTEDIEEAKQFYEMSAKNGYMLAYEYWGDCYLYGSVKDVDKAIEIYHLGADLGDSKLQCYLAEVYHTEKNNYEEAIKWYIKAAEQDDGHAQYILGYDYYRGGHFEQDLQKALMWYEKSAQNNTIHALDELGNHYFYVHREDTDYVKAVHYYNRALEIKMSFKNYTSAKLTINNLIICYSGGHGLQRNKPKIKELNLLYKEIKSQEKILKKQRKQMENSIK